MRTKKMVDQHVIDEQAQRLLTSLLPTFWLLRPYRPDYGLDYALELFKRSQTDEAGTGPSSYETLGEHVFIQLKGTRKLEIAKRHFKNRGNVEKAELQESTDGEDLEVVEFRLDSIELETIRRMGAGVPVILVVADVVGGKAFYVCLNDYIDKIIVPSGGVDRQASHAIYIPTALRLDGTERSLVALRAYAKRAKLYAAFQKITYQQKEVEYSFAEAVDAQTFGVAVAQARHFASVLLAFDFWDDCDWWSLIELHKLLLEHFLRVLDGKTALPPEVAKHVRDKLMTDPKLVTGVVDAGGPEEIWRRLAILPRQYEEVSREWWLPTPLGRALSF